MKHPLSSRFVAAALLAAAAFGAASTAQARTDVQVEIGLPGFVQPPVVLQPRAFLAPPVAYGYGPDPRPVYRADFERERAWRHAEWARREWQRREWERRQWERRHDDRYPSHGHGRD